ncbi:MAG: DUF2191 domain-containing protein [Verrucomicrobiae bacterium]|nr:DUF2191 domain-containing protein [Verrucomicrobiae bacterium]
MRTTLTLEPDVARKARKYAGEHNTSLKEVINRALRIGLEVLEKKRLPTPFRSEPKPLGLRPGISLDNIADVLDKLDEEPSR